LLSEAFFPKVPKPRLSNTALVLILIEESNSCLDQTIYLALANLKAVLYCADNNPQSWSV
jgi:hypothetical protein